MDIEQTLTTFFYPIRVYKTSTTPQLVHLHTSLTEKLSQLTSDITRSIKCSICWDSQPEYIENDVYIEFHYSVSIIGGLSQVYSARTSLLRNTPTKVISCSFPANSQHIRSLQVSTLLLLQDGKIKKDVDTYLKRIQFEYNLMITFNGYEFYRAQDDIEVHDVEIQISGAYQNVEVTFQKILIYLDEVAGYFIGRLDVDSRLSMLLGGVYNLSMTALMREMGVNVYIPSPFVKLKTNNDTVCLYVTGPKNNVAEAIERLKEMCAHRQRLMITKNITFLPKKLDWMLSIKKEELLRIMRQNGTLIQLPSLGQNRNLLSVYGSDSVYMERTIRYLMALASQYYVSVIQLHPNARLSMDILTETMNDIVRNTRAEIFIQKQFIEIYGPQSPVKDAYTKIVTLDGIKQAIKDTKFQIELALEHEDYIKGKKNGKINKITKTSECKISFQNSFNDYNMLIDLYQPSPPKAMEGLALLEDELPAEVSFHVPEMYHKRIIGVGGKNIQRIMKKYGVYVKFSNAQEHANTGGYWELKDNVIARTPSKNEENLHNLKQAIIELLDEDLHEPPKANEHFIIPRQYHLRLNSGEKIYEIESTTNTQITFPPLLEGRQDILIRGTEGSIQRAKSMLEALVPSTKEFTIARHSFTLEVLSSQSFFNFSYQILQDFLVDVSYFCPIDGIECFIILTFNPNNPNIDQVAQKVNDQILTESKNYPTKLPEIMPTIQTSQTLDSFYHFNSKLFTPISAADDKHDLMYTMLGPKSATSGAKLNHSVPDLRTVFDDARVFGDFNNGPTKPKPDLFEDSPTRDPLGLLSATLAATTLDEVFGDAVDAARFNAISPSKSSQKQIPSDAWKSNFPTQKRDFFSSTRPAGDVKLKTPNPQYCGLSLSQSVPDALNEDNIEDPSQPKNPWSTEQKPAWQQRNPFGDRFDARKYYKK